MKCAACGFVDPTREEIDRILENIGRYPDVFYTIEGLQGLKACPKCGTLKTYCHAYDYVKAVKI